jgi:hypothetical protein
MLIFVTQGIFLQFFFLSYIVYIYLSLHSYWPATMTLDEGTPDERLYILGGHYVPRNGDFRNEVQYYDGTSFR